MITTRAGHRYLWLPAALCAAGVVLLCLTAALGQAPSASDPHAGHVHPAAETTPESFFGNLLKAYVPRQQCMFYEAPVIWLHVVSDALIALAYYSIPFALVYFVRRRRDVVFSWVFWMFAGFILTCGTTHLFGVLDIWYPLYKVDGLVKLATAGLSIGTAVALWPLIPKALAIPSTTQLEQTVQQRTAELAALNETLERRVAERTAEAQRRADQLQALAAELSRAEQRERHRLARFLHDHLQQLLVGAKFNLSALQNQLQQDDLRQAAGRVDQLLDESLGMSRSLTVELSPPILYQGTLSQVLQWLARWMQDKHGLSIRLELDEQINPPAEEVRVLLFQAVRELLLNVIKHADIREASVAMSPYGATHVRIVVADNGSGFDPEARRAQGHSPTGLGLFSIRERLELLGGRMSIDSGPGRGTRITLTAPMELAATIAESEAAVATMATASSTMTLARPPAALGTGRRIRVLLADDHAVVRDGLARLLQMQAGIEVVGQAADGQEAVDLARQLRPDVVLMDVSMPRMDGMEATRQILRDCPGVRIVGLSMHMEEGVAAAMRDAGAAAYLTKTSPPEHLVAAIRTCAAGSTAAEGQTNRVPGDGTTGGVPGNRDIRTD